VLLEPFNNEGAGHVHQQVDEDTSLNCAGGSDISGGKDEASMIDLFGSSDASSTIPFFIFTQEGSV
jgi:hypothetical protein